VDGHGSFDELTLGSAAVPAGPDDRHSEVVRSRTERARERGLRRLLVGLYKTKLTSVMSSKTADHATDEGRLRLAAVDRNDPTLLHEQVAIEIRRAIAEGEALPGQRIPQAKDLAAVLGVNTNTVLRALRGLRDEGLLEVGRGRAIRVAGTPERSVVIEKMKELIDLGHRNGYRRDDLVALLENLPA